MPPCQLLLLSGRRVANLHQIEVKIVISRMSLHVGRLVAGGLMDVLGCLFICPAPRGLLDSAVHLGFYPVTQDAFWRGGGRPPCWTGSRHTLPFIVMMNEGRPPP